MEEDCTNEYLSGARIMSKNKAVKEKIESSRRRAWSRPSGRCRCGRRWVPAKEPNLADYGIPLITTRARC